MGHRSGHFYMENDCFWTKIWNIWKANCMKSLNTHAYKSLSLASHAGNRGSNRLGTAKVYGLLKELWGTDWGTGAFSLSFYNPHHATSGRTGFEPVKRPINVLFGDIRGTSGEHRTANRYN